MIYRNKGFTLLELLIVISIIGILVAAGSAAFVTAQKKGRDARRKADVKAIQDAQEQHYALNSSYLNFGSGCPAAIGDILSPVPTNPSSNAVYDYTCIGDDSAYCVEVQMESSTGNCGGCNSSDYSFDAGNDHFCVRSLQ